MTAATETKKTIVTVPAYFNDSQSLLLKKAEFTAAEFLVQNIKNARVIVPDHFNYCQCTTKTEEGSIAGYHMLQNSTISDAAEFKDRFGKKVEKDQVM